MGKEGGFRKYKRSSRGIRGKDECGSEARKDRDGRRKRF